MQVTLQAKDQDLIEAKLASGKYADESEVVHRALNLLSQTSETIPELREFMEN